MMIESLEEVRQVFTFRNYRRDELTTSAVTSVDILQLPAFLSRQTDLVLKSETQKVINIKKAQSFSS